MANLETVTYTRLQLYELVWQQPIKTLAKTLGVSDVGLAKACRRSSIPLPGSGYWAKVAAGKKLSRLPLPNDPRAPSQISFTPTERPPEKPPAPLSERQQLRADLGSLTLSTLEAPHSLVRQCQTELRRQGTDPYGLRDVSKPR
jgi:hypothetical protein